MLDTNVVSEIKRNPAGKVTARIAEVGEATLCMSIVTVAKLRCRAVKSGFSRLSARVEAVLARVRYCLSTFPE
jgi:tRNA(fMet)-specific endonuclease VapC